MFSPRSAETTALVAKGCRFKCTKLESMPGSERCPVLYTPLSWSIFKLGRRFRCWRAGYSRSLFPGHLLTSGSSG